MSKPSRRQYSGTSAAYDMNASTSGSATFARPSWSSASEVGIAVTGCSADGAEDVDAGSPWAVFGLGGYRNVPAESERVLAYLREMPDDAAHDLRGESMLCVFNLAGHPVATSLDLPEFAGRGAHLGLLDQGKTDGHQALAQDLAHAHHVLVRTQRNHLHIDVVANQDVTFSLLAVIPFCKAAILFFEKL